METDGGISALSLSLTTLRTGHQNAKKEGMHMSVSLDHT